MDKVKGSPEVEFVARGWRPLLMKKSVLSVSARLGGSLLLDFGANRIDP